MTRDAFLNYVHSFYGPAGIYPMNATIQQIGQALDILVQQGQDVAYDSFDREKIRDILTQHFGLKTYFKTQEQMMEDFAAHCEGYI